MKKILLGFFIMSILTLCGCKEEDVEIITFATVADYPPFEFYKNNVITGFDIDLATLLAKEMGKKAKFENMEFSGILAALQNGSVDAAISTITITEERQKNFDFSDSYYEESLSILSAARNPLQNIENLKHKKIACQLGTTMEIWLKKNVPTAEIMLMGNNNQAVEALKAGHADGVFIDSIQAMVFADKNPGLTHSFIAKAENGYGIAFKKGSALKKEIDNALKILRKTGRLEELKQKWLESKAWSN